jgi:aminopeptidase-like protein
MTESYLNNKAVGDFCYQLAERLFPICRSLTGEGVRKTLDILKEEINDLEVHSVESGTQCFDWVVPQEWNIKDAYILNETGEKIIDFSENNLHVVGYSEPIRLNMKYDDFKDRIFSLPDQPSAIPYVTSYYSKFWGFCVSENQRNLIFNSDENYQLVIDSELKSGELNYADILISGESDQEVLISTYICHPSMANNEISGPVVATALVKWLKSKSRKYSYRIVFIPETIGSIVYLSRHIDNLKKNVIAGFNVTCIGDDRCYSFLPSRHGDTISDRVACAALKQIDPSFKRYSWLDRGSDERQYCAPGVDLPIATIMRSKYGEYPEYHTSLDNLNLVTPSGLSGGFGALKSAIEMIEANMKLRCKVLGEPQLGKRGLYPSISTKETGQKVKEMMDLISYCDGRSLFEISCMIDQPMMRLIPIVDQLIEANVIEISDFFGW